MKIFQLPSIALFLAFIVVGIAQGQTTARATSQPAAGTGTLIVLNKDGASASIIDRVGGNEITRIDTGIGPHEVAVSPDGKIAVVGNYGQQQPGHTLTVIDLTSQNIVRTIDLEKYHRPHGIVFMPDGKHVVVTAEVEQKLLVVNIDSGIVEKAIDTSARTSHMVVLSPDAKRAYVSNIGSGSLTVIDLEAATRIKTIETGQGAEGLDISPDGSEVWVGNRGADTISIVNTESLEVVETLKCATFPIRLKFTPDGKRILISNARSGDVAIFDVKKRAEITRIVMAKDWKPPSGKEDLFRQGPVPIGIMIPPDGKHAYVANTNVNLVTVIDLQTLEIINRLTAGARPDGLGYSPLVLGKE
ncbi:MAG: beta-propeller fold lactonase family protein [Planctomycetes bacterium]|nr:beta-propeller fold lactonase family protein [Planctomycetota bacterium]